jgi:ketosteroid isomerase-like protein
MGRDKIERILHREMGAIDEGVEPWLASYSEDAVFHYPGNNPLAGDYRGHGGLREFHDRRSRLFAGADVEFELHDVLASDDHGAQLLAVRAEKGGRSAEWRGVMVCHVRDDRISEAWLLITPQAVVDEFLTAAGTPA